MLHELSYSKVHRWIKNSFPYDELSRMATHSYEPVWNAETVANLRKTLDEQMTLVSVMPINTGDPTAFLEAMSRVRRTTEELTIELSKKKKVDKTNYAILNARIDRWFYWFIERCFKFHPKHRELSEQAFEWLMNHEDRWLKKQYNDIRDYARQERGNSYLSVERIVEQLMPRLINFLHLKENEYGTIDINVDHKANERNSL